MEIDFDLASLMWKTHIQQPSFYKSKKQTKIPWQSSRCGFLKDNGTQCLKKSHFSKKYKIEHPKIDVDECDLKFFCYEHIKNIKTENIKQRIFMEKKILERIKTQNEFYVSDLSYIQKLKEKYNNK